MNIKKIKNNIINIKEGFFRDKDYISGSYINMTNPKYIEIDNIYYSHLFIVNYYREYNDLLLKNLIELDINMNISCFYEKQDSYKTIRDLTYHIGNVGVELSDKNNNRPDIEIAAFTYQDAKYIRREMQVNNEEMYFIYLYCSIFSNSIKELEYAVNKVEGIAQSMGLQTRRANFRQEQAFISCLPFMQNPIEMKKVTRRNVLTNSLVCTYPFISSTIFDEDGIYIGDNIYNHSQVFIDRYHTEKYKNANMCIFGTSGAGKSFYIKLLIIRYRLLGIEQYIIDPEREYENLTKKLDGTLIKIGPSSKTYINIFDIRENSMEETEGYLASKIQKLIGFFNLIFGEINEEEKAILEEKIIECYAQKGITFDDKTLYNSESDKIVLKPVFKQSKDMPILQDLYNVLDNEKTKHMKIKLIPFIKRLSKIFKSTH